MKHKIPHDLDIGLARRATRAALEGYRKQFPQFSPGGTWTDDDNASVWFVTPVGRIEGTITVMAKAVQLHLTKLPWAARPFRRQAVKIVEDEVNHWIKKAKNGKLPAE